MPDPIEPKQTVNDTMDAFFESKDGGEVQPQETAQPETEQVVTQEEDGSGPVTTPSTPEAAKDKGFASHPKWIERENKLKEAEARAKQLEQDSSRYAKLLDDPATYKRFLESQGFRPEQIAQAMAEKGMTVEAKAPTNTPAAQDIAEATCKKLGWDITRLNSEQRAYINDQISLIKAVAEDMFGPQINERLRPIEGFLEEQRIAFKTQSEFQEAQKLAKEEFPHLDWDKDIIPLMDNHIKELDKKDPQTLIRFNNPSIEIYKEATRSLFRELRVSEGRQEVRNNLKKNARPLVSHAPVLNGERTKGKSVRETADSFLDSVGMKND